LTAFPARAAGSAGRLLAVALLAAGVGFADDGPEKQVPSPPAAPPPVAPASPPERTSLGIAFDSDALRDLPGAGDPGSLLETVDATAILDRIENGGLFTGEPSRLGVHGASWTQASYRLGDLDITDPAAIGAPLLLSNLAWLQGIDVSSGLMAAASGGPGPVVSLIPRRPGDAWHRTVEGSFVPTGLQASPSSGPPAIARYQSFASGRFGIHGPLVKDRLGLLLDGAYARVQRLERSDPTPLEGREIGLLAHLVWTPTPRDEGRLLAAFQGADHPYAGRSRFGGANARESDRFLALQTTWERRGTTLFGLSAGFVRGTFEPQLPSSDSGAVVERLRDGPVPGLFPGDGARWRGSLAARMERVVEGLGGTHALRFGLSADWTRATTRPPVPGGTTAETVAGLPARVWDYGWAGPESRWRAFEIAPDASDRMSFGRLLLDAGLRFESANGSAEASPGEVHWNGLLPRLSARLHLTRGGGLTLFGGYARYQDRLSLHLLAFGDPAAAQGLVYRWDDRNGDHVAEPDEVGPLVARVGPGGAIAAIDPGLKPPHTDEVSVGLEARLSKWTVHFLGLHRRQRDLVASVDTGAPIGAYTVYYVPDPSGNILSPEDDQLLPIYDRRPESFGQDRYVLTNPEGDNVLHEGVELSVEGRVGERFWIRLGGTASRTVGPGANRGFKAFENDSGVVGERLEDPNAATFSQGRSFFDRAYTLKLASTYHAPWDVRLGAVARYQDGQPFARLVIPEVLNQGPDPVQAIPNGRSRFTYTLTVDVRLEKGFKIGSTRAAAVLEAFNLLNTANEVEEDVTSGSHFRTVTAVQPPRAFRLGARLDF
jgi:hypothetical protein